MLWVLGRDLHLRKTCGRLLDCTFNELCNRVNKLTTFWWIYNLLPSGSFGKLIAIIFSLYLFTSFPGSHDARYTIQRFNLSWRQCAKTYQIMKKLTELYFYQKTHTADSLHPAFQFGKFLQVRLQQPSSALNKVSQIFGEQI